MAYDTPGDVQMSSSSYQDSPKKLTPDKKSITPLTERLVLRRMDSLFLLFSQALGYGVHAY